MSSEARLLTIAFRSFWHAGTGRAGGEDADALVDRDHDGLPILRGRHIKGVLRHVAVALAEWGVWQAEQVALLFGQDAADSRISLLSGRHATRPGCIAIADAKLPPALRARLSNPSLSELRSTTQRERLFVRLAATAIDPMTGAARDKSLRAVEVVVPLRLQTILEWDDVEARACAGTATEAIDQLRGDWPDMMGSCFPYVDALGAHRTRGLGRAVLSLGGVP